MEKNFGKDELLKISEIADFFGTTPKALRIYEQKGIIIPCKIDPESGYRYYSADQVKKLNLLIELQELGFSVDNCAHLSPYSMTDFSLQSLIFNFPLFLESQKRHTLQK